MIRYQKIAFTAYAVSNISRARKFYEGVLDLKLSRKFGRNFLEYDIGPSTLVVASAPGMWDPSRKGTCAALEVADFDAVLKQLKKKKIKPAIGPRESPLCWMVGVRDPDGNMITLHKRKKASRQR